ncbi:MAG TPA: hypothetical protein VGN36_03705 [Sphingorhabdus sp.]|jgi:hypothetical protein|nr:hypothetical protein [Sphingorhabdus sp.]
MRGRHFGFIGILSAVWVSARVGFLSLPLTQADFRIEAQTAARQVGFEGAHKAAPVIIDNHEAHPAPFVDRPTRARPWVNLMAAEVAAAPPLSGSEAIGPAMPVQALAPTAFFPAIKPPPVSRPASRTDIYAYSFIRSGAGQQGLQGGGQYGGSQSGVIMTHKLDAKRNLSLLLRGTVAHDRPRERELATGLRWQPLAKIPVTLTAERRWRNARGDAVALYLAGGQSDIALPRDFRLEAYGQAGLISGRDGGPFFDFATRAKRKLVTLGALPVTIGGGAWGGGQENIFRIDTGPTIGTQIPLGSVQLRIDADWRFRIAGDARPANGPALTLSTSF